MNQTRDKGFLALLDFKCRLQKLLPPFDGHIRPVL